MVEVAAKRWSARKEMVRSVADAVQRIREIQNGRKTGLEVMKKGPSEEPPAKLQKTDNGYKTPKKALKSKKGTKIIHGLMLQNLNLKSRVTLHT